MFRISDICPVRLPNIDLNPQQVVFFPVATPGLDRQVLEQAVHFEIVNFPKVFQPTPDRISAGCPRSMVVGV